jgi:hypothetical protein
MRLWSLDPSYLDVKGLGAVWREALLAQAVLVGQAKGWRNHPQLLRFSNHDDPVSAIGFYLLKIHEEASQRGYNYQQSKIIKQLETVSPINVTRAQLLYEFHILNVRVKIRAPHHYKINLVKSAQQANHPQPHPLFRVVKGEVELWEKSYWNRNGELENKQVF